MSSRHTIQGALVLDFVNKMEGHATADEIYEALSREYPTISRATVYRHLQRLCDEGKLRRREIPSGADRFDHLCTDHYHIRCVGCGKVFDVDMDYAADLERSIRDTHGFVFTAHDIVFKGICPSCQSGE